MLQQDKGVNEEKPLCHRRDNEAPHPHLLFEQEVDRVMVPAEPRNLPLPYPASPEQSRAATPGSPSPPMGQEGWTQSSQRHRPLSCGKWCCGDNAAPRFIAHCHATAGPGARAVSRDSVSHQEMQH